jgi:hypothetical protein
VAAPLANRREESYGGIFELKPQFRGAPSIIFLNMSTPPNKPAGPLNLLELLRAIGKKPGMYIGNCHSIWHLKTFIVGFQSGSIGRGPYQEGDLILDSFTFWVCTRFGIPDGAMDWSGHIWRHCGEDDEAAFRMFFELFEEYIKEREQVGPEAIKARFLEMLESFHDR